MIRLLIAIALIATPNLLSAQVQPLHIQGAGEPVEIPLARHRGYPAYPITALRRLGAELRTTPEGARVAVFGDTLVFETQSPFFLAARRPQQLVAPVYAEGGILYLPHQFFAEWLPARYGDRVEFDGGVLRVLNGQAVAADTTTSRPASPTPAPARTTRTAPDKRVVIIDPGHGGKDPGKPGPNGLREKDVALQVAKRLAEELRSREGYEVHLTRTTDTLIALADRPRMANEWKAGRPAALFVSIHANSVSNRSVRGFETFFLSAARTEDEQRVAEMENAAIEFEDAHVPGAGQDLDWILNTLRNDFYLRASNDLAEVIQRKIGEIHPGPNRGVKQAGFRVLIGAFMPAVLVEMAFISNRQEAELLGSAQFQTRISRALADAIEEFFRTHEHLWVSDETT